MQTVITVFEDHRAAQSAFDRLLRAGFQRHDVHLQAGVAQANIAVTATPGASAVAQTGPERSVLSSIGRFFASLFGQDPPTGYVDRYSEAIWHGHPVIVVDAKDEDEAGRASAILHEFGVFDIDRRAHWHGAALRAGARPAAGSPLEVGKNLQQPRHIFPGSVRDLERERAMAAAREREEDARDRQQSASAS
jgi:hypothetical protein